MESQTVENVVEYQGWRMYESTARQLKEAKQKAKAKPAAQTQVVMEGQKEQEAEEATNKLFRILQGNESRGEELTTEAYAQFLALSEGRDYRPLPAKVKAENERYRSEQKAKDAKEQELVEALAKCFNESDWAARGSADSDTANALYELLKND